ncbi:hypothetical protein [Umezawaea beigongshangensis]|uniref:hypothetical protein n=1 Tax=Umezawaea beigongshangensis TaxID=2780383 RepID=UPI0018F14BEA|nr:hypothetical protein [Umezawaea beigongshangensis]
MKWPVLRVLCRALVSVLVVVWAAALVFVAVLVPVVSIWREVTISGWNVASVQAGRWFLFGLGYYAVHDVLPAVIAHGRTRREFAAQAAVVTLVVSGAAALLVAVGFGLEFLLYRAMDWTQRLGEQGTFSSATDFPAIVWAHWAVFAVWMVVGAMVAAGFDRLGGGGLVVVPVGVALILPPGLAVNGSNSLPFLPTLGSWGSVPTAVVLLLCAVSWAVGLAVTWSLVRDLPVRARAV